jgi:uncharacterized protein YukE
MKRVALLAVAVLLATAANLWGAEERPNPYRPGAAGAPTATFQPKSAAQWYIDSLDPVVGLTDQQKKAITQVIESRDKTMREFQSKHAEKLSAASKAIGEAYQKNDKEAIAKAQKAYQEAYAPIHQAMKESQKKLDEILTPRQKEKQADRLVATWLNALTSPIELSAEQKQKAKTAFREAQKAADHETVERTLPEVVRKILTPQQRVAINKYRLGSYLKAMFARVKLTGEQNKKLDALVDKLCSDPDLNVDWQTYQSASKKVEELLTTEQKETWKSPLGAWNQAVGGVPVPGGAPGINAYSFVPGGAPGTRQDQASQYWIGLTAEPGLVVETVAPESPAAKAGIKTHDVILAAGGRATKGLQDLVGAIEQAKGKDLVLEVIRDGKQQKITVKPAKRPAEGVVVLEVEDGATGEKSASGTKVLRLSGGGLQVIVSEGNERAEGKAAAPSPEASRKELEKAIRELRTQVDQLRRDVDELKRRPKGPAK